MLLIFLSASLLLTFAGFLSQWGWLFDLASHFRVQYLCVLVILAILYLCKKQWKLLILAFMGALINLILIIPFWASVSKTTERGNLSILLMNVNSRNAQYDTIMNYIHHKNPDIVALQEVTHHWIKHFDELAKLYPYQKSKLQDDNFGIALLSKIPPKEMDIVYTGLANVPSILMESSIENQDFTLFFTHPVPPITPRYYSLRNEQFQKIIEKRKAFNDNLILIGDLNTSPWSYHFQNLVNKLNLYDARIHQGLNTSWPTLVPFLSIPIDHILVSKYFNIHQFQKGPDIGSDHYPVFIKLDLSERK